MTASKRPCPICNKETNIIGKDSKGRTLTECAHRFSFKQTKSEKISQRGWVNTPWGLEKITDGTEGSR